MKILVCISKVPDTTSKIAFTDGDTKFDENNVQFILNPYDDWYALVRALEITEAQGGEVELIHVGPKDNDPIIRKALAVGGNKAVRIDAEATDASFVASEIANYAKANGFDLVLTGKETINYNGGSVGAMIAEHLDSAYIPFATSLEVTGNTATIVREIEGGSETLEVATPCVLSAQKGMAEQRIPNMRGIMAARSKPLEVVSPSSSIHYTSSAKFVLPPAKKDCQYIDAENAAELISILHNEAKVI